MTITAKKIRQSLIEQLEKKGADVDVYRGLVEDYVWLWQQQKAMKDEIRKRGRTYMATSASGKPYEKNNPDVKDAILYNKQMVAILDALELSTKTLLTDKEDGMDEDL